MKDIKFYWVYITSFVLIITNCSYKVQGTLDGDIQLNIAHPDSVVTEIIEFIIINDSLMSQLPTFNGNIDSLEKIFKRPDLARNAGIYGKTTIEFDINENGLVENVIPIKYLTIITDELINNLKNIKFNPAIKAKNNVKANVRLTILYYRKDKN